MPKIKHIATILFFALFGQLDAQIAKEWVIGYDYTQISPLKAIYRTLNFKSSSTRLDTANCTINARIGRNINRSLLADSVGNFYVLNLVQNLLQPKTDTFYTELGSIGIDYRQSMLIRNPRIDSVFYYLTLQHYNNKGGFSKNFGAYLSTFSDS
tara:strand:+ start:987 stop:1448 length:462 start_codon:yes stop_codon:yes gene_type:complete